MQLSLKQQTITGIIWSSLQRFGTIGVSFLSNIILARLLNPEDYGCIGILAIFIAVSNVFVYGGFASALIQKQKPTQADYSTVFFWNILTSVLFYGLLYLSAPYIADFYNIQLLSDVLRIQSIILLINAISIVQLNILRKDLQFKKISLIQLIAVCISVVITIFLAFNGWGIWSLVTQQLMTSLIATIILWSICDWRPSFIFSKKSFIELFSYGSYLLFSDLLNTICDNIQGLIIGKRFSSNIMGYYSQAKRLEEVPTTTISYVVQQVTFPVYAKIQDDKSLLFIAVRKSLRMMNFINFPLMFLLIIVAEPLFVLLFSEKWLNSVPYFQILCIAGIVNCMQSVNYHVVCAVGQSKKIFKWNILKRIAGIILILIGMNWGVEGILIGMVISFYFTYVVNAMIANDITGYTISKQFKDALPILLICIITSILTSINMLFDNISYVNLLVIETLMFLGIYISIAYLTNREEIKEYINIVKPYLCRHD